MSRIIDLFPGLKALNLDPAETVSAVNDALVLEIGARLGTYTFGKDAVAHADLAVWIRPTVDQFNVIVAEFGWSYHVRNDVTKKEKSHENADTFFKDLQVPLVGELFDGTTKTALVYTERVTESEAPS